MSKRIALVTTCLAVFVALCGGSLAAAESSVNKARVGTVKLKDFNTAVPAKREPVLAYDKWKWFKSTYWIVPQNGIYSIFHPDSDPNKFSVIRGQTVFHITDYFNGFWTGSVVVRLTRALVPSCQYVLGEVTPEGAVYLSMYDATSGALRNTPVGEMVKEGNEWTMVNQMTIPAQGGTLSHWAYMVQSKKKSRTYSDLPFAHESIPKFMSGCPAGPKITRP